MCIEYFQSGHFDEFDAEGHVTGKNLHQIKFMNLLALPLLRMMNILTVFGRITRNSTSRVALKEMFLNQLKFHF